MHDLGFGDVDGSNAVGVVGYGSTGQEAWDKIWHYERNYFNGEAPSFAGIQNSDEFIHVDPAVAIFHCPIESTNCQKFVNPETGQEFVYIKDEEGNWAVSQDSSILGTYNYSEGDTLLRDMMTDYYGSDPGSAPTQHYWRDVAPYNELGNSPNDPGFPTETIMVETPRDGIEIPREIELQGTPSGVDVPRLPENPDQ